MPKYLVVTLIVALFCVCKVHNSQELVAVHSLVKLPSNSDCHCLHFDGVETIYIFGLCGLSDKVYRYSFLIDFIEEINTLPDNFENCSLQPDGQGNLLIFGSHSNRLVLSYNILENAISTLTSMPFEISHPLTLPSCIPSEAQNTVYIFGTTSTSPTQENKILSFDLLNNTFTELDIILPALFGASAVCVDGRVFVFLDYRASNEHVWELGLNSMNMLPLDGTELPYIWPSSSSVSVGDSIYVIAGFHLAKDCSKIIQFDAKTGFSNFITVRNWIVEDGKRSANHAPKCVFVTSFNRIYCLGGKSIHFDGLYAKNSEIFYLDLSQISEPTTPAKEIITTSKNEIKYKEEFVVICVLSILLLISTAIITCLCCTLQKKTFRNKSLVKVYEEFKCGMKNVEACVEDNLGVGNYYKALVLPLPKSLELSANRLVIEEEAILGRGAFGIVFQGKLDEEISVAVKTLAENADEGKLAALLSEIKVMSFVGDHSNIVKLLGVQNIDSKKGRICVALELCPLGSLERVLRAKKEQLRIPPGTYHIPGYVADLEERTPFSTNQLLKFSLQVCCAMDFLVSKKIIHGDLATRNVMIDANFSAKISDFGLSRQIYDYKKYVTAAKDSALPWRWLSPEVLHSLKFSHASDCWAFGVFMWEVFSLADIPYSAAVKWGPEFIAFLERGKRLTIPKYASGKIFNVMSLCWDASPPHRPTFRNLLNQLKRLEMDDLKILEEINNVKEIKEVETVEKVEEIKEEINIIIED